MAFRDRGHPDAGLVAGRVQCLFNLQLPPPPRAVRPGLFRDSSSTTTGTSTPPRSSTPPRPTRSTSTAAAQMLVTLAGAMSTAELGLSLAEMIRQGKVHAHLLHRREPRGGRLQPRRARPLRARPALPRPHAGRRAGAARPAPEPRHRHLHPRGRGDAPHRERRARGVAARRQAPASAASRTSSSTRCCVSGALEAVLPDRPEGQLAARGGRARTCRCSCRAGRTRRSATSSPATASTGDVKNVAHRAHRHRVHDARSPTGTRRRRAKRSIGFFQIGGGIAGDFPICVVPMLQQDLQRADVPLLGLLLPDQRLDDELRLVLGRRAQREDHLGQARHRHAEVHHRVRRHDRRAADVRPRAGMVRENG